MQRIRRRLTFANAFALLAFCLALGGVSYAATSLPQGSVGSPQLKRHSVTGSKLASKGVHKRALAHGIKAELARTGQTGPQGPPGPAGPGAGRIRYSAQGTPAGTPPATALDYNGLTLKGSCQQSGGNTSVTISVESDENAVLQDEFTFDSGTDPHTPGTTTTGVIQINLSAGVDTPMNGPSATAPDFSRVVATVIYESQSRTMTVNVVSVVDGATGRCSIDGTAVAA